MNTEAKIHELKSRAAAVGLTLQVDRDGWSIEHMTIGRLMHARNVAGVLPIDEDFDVDTIDIVLTHFEENPVEWKSE